MRLLLISCLFLLGQYWEDTECMKALKAHVAEITLAQNEGRAPGSEGEKFVSEYVWRTLADAGVDMLTTIEGDRFGVVRDCGDTVVSRNIIGFLPGYDPILRSHYIVIGAHMDNLGVGQITIDGEKQLQVYTGANGNASGLAIMLELAGRIAENKLLCKRSVIFVGFGSSTASFAGAWHFLRDYFAKDKSRIDAMVNLDILGIDKEGLFAFSSGNDDLNEIIRNVSSTPQPVKATIAGNEPYPSDHQVFYANEISSVCFTSGRYPEHNTPRDVAANLNFEFMERECEYIYNFLLKLINAREGIPSFRDVPVEANAPDPVTGVRSWADCDQPPIFLGSPDPNYFMYKWVYTYLKYPEACIKDGIQGKVVVKFTIDKKGEVKDVKVIKGVDEELDEAAVKVVAASPKWKPAKVNGQKVDCTMTIPVIFKLKKKK